MGTLSKYERDREGHLERARRSHQANREKRLEQMRARYKRNGNSMTPEQGRDKMLAAAIDDDFDTKVVAFLSQELRNNTPFPIAWDKAMKHIKPRYPIWERRTEGCSPIEFFKRHARQEYEARAKVLHG
jgi:hypothetical protein